jgi:hypothetical protein
MGRVDAANLMNNQKSNLEDRSQFSLGTETPSGIGNWRARNNNTNNQRTLQPNVM